MKEEVWKDIENFEGIYQVSNLGRVKSLDREVKSSRKHHITYKIKGKIRSISYKNGYQALSLFKDTRNTNTKVHRLVATAFIPNPENKPTVNHKDGDKSNNNKNNLEWATRTENMQHAYDNSLIKRRLGKDNDKSKPVVKLDLEGNIIKEYGSQLEAERETKISASDISKCCRGKSHTAGGYKWATIETHDKDISELLKQFDL